MTIPADHRAILRYFWALVLILATATILLLTATFFVFSAELQANRRIEEFHLRTLVLLGEVQARIVEAKPSLLRAQGGTEPAHDLGPMIYSIGKALSSVEDIQDEFGDPAFRQTLQRARRQHDEMLAAYEESTWDRSRHDNELASLGFTIHQLSRLHALAVEEELAGVSSLRSPGALQIVTAVLVLVTPLVIARLYVLVRGRLREQLATEQALRQTQMQVMQAEKIDALGTLVGGVAHDFNNILTSILGNAEHLLVKSDPQDPAVRGLRQIQSSGERAAGITRQLLLFSRKEVGETSVVDLGLLVRDLAPLLRRLAREDIELLLELDDFLGTARVDPIQIEQVLINLTVNARDAMPAGGRLTIRGRLCELGGEQAEALNLEPGRYVQISAIDTGDGMSAEVQARVFDPFFTTKELGRGTGLGLSMVHGIVTRSGGRIALDSKLGEGTTFDVYLPCSGEASVPAPAPMPAEHRGGDETILIVEDEDMVRDVAASALREANYRVIVAKDAADAERLCCENENAIDLILTDVVMPGMRGPDLVDRIRGVCPDCAVVFMSGYSETSILKSVEASGHSFLSKPFRRHRLLATVRAALDARVSPSPERSSGR